ncbi:universal stress protein [Algoriphagus kandeliae]|uniref:Universal stress protein n=1 Tax=Algoriphagus kandeliae TaxID=2562278 RepID=A0A4Y9QZI2_9BACT|nr:universal stress protein [Algoriphagus kandeliae]TFV97557.1 universal stress protein [Algoriphagus kandeliae]
MKILIPLDFSENSKKALEFALGIFQDSENTFILCHVVEMVYDFASQAAIAIEGLHASARKHMGELILEYNSPNAEFHAEILEGTPSIQLAKLAEEKGVDLIIMGTHGISGIKKVLVGSTAVNVLKESSIPVLLVPEEANTSNTRKISLALELADHEEELIEKVANWSKVWNMDIQIIHVIKEQNFVEKLALLGLEKYLDNRLGYIPTIHSRSDHDVTHGIQEYVNSHTDSMLTMCHSQKNLWDQLLRKGTSIEMAYKAKTPLLVMI